MSENASRTFPLEDAKWTSGGDRVQLKLESESEESADKLMAKMSEREEGGG
jgi:hypothetical protein